MNAPPFDMGKDSLFVGYYTPADFSVFHALGWELPRHVLDLFCESRVATNGMVSPSGKSYPKNLLACLDWYKVGSMGSSFKESMRDIIL